MPELVQLILLSILLPSSALGGVYLGFYMRSKHPEATTRWALSALTRPAWSSLRYVPFYLFMTWMAWEYNMRLFAPLFSSGLVLTLGVFVWRLLRKRSPTTMRATIGAE